jgi:hypothetical protein
MYFFCSAARRTAVAPLVVGLALTGFASAAPALMIDDFISVMTASYEFPADNVSGTGSTAGAAPSAIGLNRKLYVTGISGLDGDRLRLRSNPGGATRLSLSTDDSVTGYGEVVWDGTTNVGVTSYTGLGGLDLTGGGINDSIQIDVYNEDLPATLTMTLWTDVANFAIGTLNLPGSIITTDTTFFLDFSAFAITGASFSFDDIGAARLRIQATNPNAPGLDMSLNKIETVDRYPTPHPTPLPPVALLMLPGLWALARRRHSA